MRGAFQFQGLGLRLQRTTEVAIGLYTGYNAAATIASLPAGRLSDRFGPIGILVAGVFFFLVTYLGFAVSVSNITRRPLLNRFMASWISL